MTFSGLNYLAVLVAAIAAWLTGAAWYGVLGNRWLKASGRGAENIERKRGAFAFDVLFVLAFVANLVMAWVLAGIIGHFGPGQVTMSNGVITALFVWLGFVVTTTAVDNAFAGRKPMLTVLDAGHWLAVLVVAGAVIGAFGV